MRIIEEGSGHPVLLLHGTPSSSLAFAPLVEALRPIRRVLTVDLPGYNGAPGLDRDQGIEDATAMIADALATRGIQELDVVGFSSGAYRAVSLALSGRVRVSRLVLTSGAVVFDPSDRARFAGIAGQLRAGANLRPLMPRVMLSPGYAAAHPEAVSEVEGWLDIVSTEDLANEFEAFSRCPAVMPGFAALAIPMTLRFGELDEGVSSAHVAEMQRSNARLVVERVAGVGHSLLIEDTTATVASIVRALAADLRP